MQTAEFEADVSNGIIQIPTEYRQLFRNSVHVTLSSDEPDRRAEAVRRMNELFERVSGFQVEPRIPREELYERGSLR